MTMPYSRSRSEWVKKYSIKPILTKETLYYYKWCEKIGRKEYLRRSRIKSERFEKNHPGNLKFRVFKSRILKPKRVSNKIIVSFRTIIEKNNSVKGLTKLL